MSLLTMITDVDALRTLDSVVHRHSTEGELADHVRGLLLAGDLAEISAGRLGAVGPGIALVCTEFFNMMFNTWWLRRRCGYRSPVKFVLRLLVPTAASVVVTLLLSGQHVVLILVAAAVAYLATSAVVGPVTWSTLASLRRNQLPA